MFAPVPVYCFFYYFQFPYVNDIGPRCRNDLDLQYSHTFINSISCVHLPDFRSEAAIVFEKPIVFTFSYREAQVTKFDLAAKYVKVNLGLSFEQTMLGWTPRCYMYKSTCSEEEDFSRIFTIYGRGGHLGHLGHLGHMCQMPRTNLRSLYPWRLHTKLGFD